MGLWVVQFIYFLNAMSIINSIPFAAFFLMTILRLLYSTASILLCAAVSTQALHIKYWQTKCPKKVPKVGVIF